MMRPRHVPTNPIMYQNSTFPMSSILGLFCGFNPSIGRNHMFRGNSRFPLINQFRGNTMFPMFDQFGMPMNYGCVWFTGMEWNLGGKRIQFHHIPMFGSTLYNGIGILNEKKFHQIREKCDIPEFRSENIDIQVTANHVVAECRHSKLAISSTNEIMLFMSTFAIPQNAQKVDRRCQTGNSSRTSEIGYPKNQIFAFNLHKGPR